MDSTQPVFIVTSGRSGSATLARLLGQFDKVEAHHEYMVHHVQPLSARYYAGLINSEQAKLHLRKIYYSAIHYSQAPIWLDSSNKVSFLIKPLSELFPTAKWIYLVRDGRRVVSSYYNKLGNEIYDDQSTQIMIDYLMNKNKIIPPPEKKYWWPVPRLDWNDSPFKNFNQFQRICWYWVEVNRSIIKDLSNCLTQRFMIPLEDLRESQDVLMLLLDFAGIRYSSQQLKDSFQFLQKPHNVSEPKSYRLTPEQVTQFWATEGMKEMMDRLGYKGKMDYEVEY